MLNFSGTQLSVDLTKPCRTALRARKLRATTHKTDTAQSQSRRTQILLALLISLSASTMRGAYADLGGMESMHDPVGIGDPETYRDYADEAYRKMLKKRKKR